jgi:hypothetical protein
VKVVADWLGPDGTVSARCQPSLLGGRGVHFGSLALCGLALNSFIAQTKPRAKPLLPLQPEELAPGGRGNGDGDLITVSCGRLRDE